MKSDLIELYIKPFSINAMYYTHKAAKTTKAKEWTYKAFDQLSLPSNTAIMDRIRDSFDPSKHYFHVDLICYYPKNIFFNKQNSISAKTIDMTNWEKPLIDLVFLPKHHLKEPPFGVLNIGYDDRYISSINSKKIAWDSPGHLITCSVSILSSELLYPSPKPNLDK